MENLAINNEQSVDTSQQMGTAVNSDKQIESEKYWLWKKGQSGNLKGRPKFSLKGILREILQDVPEGEKESEARKFVKMTIKQANEGDFNSQKLIWNYIDGLPTQTIAGDSENPLILQLNNVIANKNGLNNTTSKDSGSE